LYSITIFIVLIKTYCYGTIAGKQDLMNITKKTIKRFIVTTIFLIALLIYPISMTGCSSEDDESGINQNDGPVELTILRNKLLVGTDASYPPFEFIQDTEIVGFDIDIASEIAFRLDKEMEIVPIEWDFSYEMPEDEKLDMIISAISIEENSNGSVDFSEPYYIMEFVFLVLSDAELQIKEDLKGKKIGMISHETKDLPAEYLSDYMIEEYKDVILMLEELRNRNIDGLLISIPVGKNIIEEDNAIYRVLKIIESEKAFSIVFHKGSLLKDEVNRILSEMNEDGTYQEIYEKWFLFSIE